MFRFIYSCIVLCTVLVHTQASAQDFVNQRLAKVQHSLSAENASYRSEVDKDDFIIILNEMNDTAIWKFDSTNRCYEYILVLPQDDYPHLCVHLEDVGEKVMKDVYVNRHDMTFTFIEKKNGKLVVHTRPFNPRSNTPALYFSTDE